MTIVEAIAEVRSLFPRRMINCEPRYTSVRDGEICLSAIWIYVSGAEAGTCACSGTFPDIDSMMERVRIWEREGRETLVEELGVANAA